MLIGAWLLDRVLGEPRAGHPLNGFARIAGWLERLLNRNNLPAAERRKAGMLAVGILVGPAVLLTTLFTLGPLGWVVELGLLYLCLGGRSLREHALGVAQPLARGDLAGARAAVARIVSRDAQAMDAEDTARATTESTLENGNDAVFATLFWFLVAGAPGAVAHRLVNTLDALWGYRTPRFTDFGYAAARLDDLLGWIPARLTALTYALAGLRPQAVWSAVRAQAPQWPGSNPGVVLAAGAAALDTTLGGPAVYTEGVRHRPTLGTGQPADADTIERSVALVERGVLIWIAAAIALWAPSPLIP
nr:adenosylcobinamide-phosphate synthase CbiB [Halorhodospira halophila]